MINILFRRSLATWARCGARVALCCLFAWCATASALTRDGTLEALRHTGWGPNSGAPSGNAIVQTTDGYLWLGSQSGLFRFDGLRFERVELPVPSRNVFQLYAPRSGGLWIGLVAGGAVFMKDGVFKSWSANDGAPKGSVMSFAEGSDGVVWAAGGGGLYRFDGAHWQPVPAAWGFPAKDAYSLMMDSADTLWVASDRAFFSLRKGATTFQSVPVHALNAFSFAESPDGAVWLWDDTGLRPVARNANPGHRTSNSGRNLLFDRDGALWMKNDDAAVRRLARPGSTVGAAPIPLGDLTDVLDDKHGFVAGHGPTAIAEDREGNVWTFGQLGLDRFSERRLTPLATGIPLTTTHVALAAGVGAGLWLSNRDEQGEAMLVSGGHVEPFKGIRGTSAALAARDGSTWLGGAFGLWRYDAGKMAPMPTPPGMKDAEIQAMADDAAGGVWVQYSRRHGVFRWADGAWMAMPTDEAGSLVGGYARVLSTDAAGRVWSGGYKGRIAVQDRDQVRIHAAPQLGIVTAIYGRRHDVWAGGDLGLARLQGGTFQSVLPESGKEFSSITGLVETANGDLWLNGANGISHVTAEQLRLAAADPAYRVKVELIDLLDGFEGTSARTRPVPTLAETADGRLWFVSSAGVYWLDPARIAHNPLPPSVVVQSIDADGTSHPARPDIALPQRTRALQIDYVGLSLTQPERIRYRYRLEGFDNAWQDVGSRRQAFYTNLPPGTYRFHVTAMNNDGVWNETGATVDFTIPPAFVQTGWFVALCVVAGGLCLWLLVVMRMRQLEARTRSRYEVQIAERERIARELHDTLLQSTQGLILGCQVVANGLAPGDPQRALLERSLDDADGVLAEARSRVMDLRLPLASPADLGDAFTALANSLSAGTPTRVQVSTEGSSDGLRARVKDEAYCIGREATINAFRHARAGTIEIRIVHASDGLRLQVRDDGVGIDAATLATRSRPGHWGLRGMEERARGIGGTLALGSHGGVGTEVELVVPAEHAHDAPKRRMPWSTWFRSTRRRQITASS